jgi:hypothetical protein
MLVCLFCDKYQRSTCPDKRLRPELMYETGAVTVLQTALPHDDACNKHIASCRRTVLTILHCMTQHRTRYHITMVPGRGKLYSECHYHKQECAKQDMQSCTARTACSMSPTASEAATTTSPACIANMYDGTLCYSLQSSSAIALSCKQDLSAITWAEVCL